ncbi:MAG: flavin reductase family protein [Nitrososphaerota archaeon]|nr:flavin reductase family protein [Candidatus Calditenuis fumarioli]
MSEAFRKALRTLTYGLYVVTSRSGGELSAATVNFLTQTSFNPPLVVVALKRDSGLQRAVESSRSFAVNVLSADQKQLAADFFKPVKVEGNNINGHPFRLSRTLSLPVLEECPAWFECQVVEKVDQGDHVIYVGKVVDGELVRQADRYLVMWDTGWYYGG